MEQKVGMLYICTGEYVAFWENFYKSFEKFFLPESYKEYFVFTDADSIYDEQNNDRIHRIYQENLGWPGNTLFRYRIFMKQKERLRKFDWLYFMNANAICKQTIREEFMPAEGLLFVQHPGYFNKSSLRFPYEHRKKSMAYIPYGKGKIYICGGVNGGESEKFLRLIEELSVRIDQDYKNGIIAKWHDESQINKYMLQLKEEEYKVLSPSYCYPEDWAIPFEEIITILNKEKVINVKKIKSKRKFAFGAKKN